VFGFFFIDFSKIKFYGFVFEFLFGGVVEEFEDVNQLREVDSGGAE